MNKRVTTGLVVAVVVFVVSMLIAGGMEDSGGGRVRMNVLAAAVLTPLYLLGGKVAVSLLVGTIAGLLAWFITEEATVVPSPLSQKEERDMIRVSEALISRYPVAGAGQTQLTPHSSKQSVPRLLNEGMPKRRSDVYSADVLAEKISASAPHTITSTSEPSLKTELATEENHWATAMVEVERGQCRPGVWAKAFVESEGDETKTKVAYLKARVQQLTDTEDAKVRNHD
jgi:hypothetical protein